VARRKILGRKEFIPPVIRVTTATGDGWQLTLDVEERALIVRLMAELRALVEGPDDNALLQRLFPNAYPDDEEKEAEYQRLMREELVASRVAAIESVSALLDPEPAADGSTSLDGVWDEGQTIAFMQSINAIRLVLGSLLGIDDDEAADDAEHDESPEHQLYDFLSWVLDASVRAAMS
jgi:hypothetical protein